MIGMFVLGFVAGMVTTLMIGKIITDRMDNNDD